jgi:hypothetical protein
MGQQPALTNLRVDRYIGILKIKIIQKGLEGKIASGRQICEIFGYNLDAPIERTTLARSGLIFHVARGRWEFRHIKERYMVILCRCTECTRKIGLAVIGLLRVDIEVECPLCHKKFKIDHTQVRYDWAGQRERVEAIVKEIEEKKNEPSRLDA